MEFVLTAIMPAGINNNPPEKVDNGDKVGEVNDVLMFPDPIYQEKCQFGETCCRFKAGTCRYTHVKSSLTCLKEYLWTAQVSLDVCVFMFNETSLTQHIQALRYNNKVAVRIICHRPNQRDHPQDYRTVRTWMTNMEKLNIQVRLATPATGGFMHHKFAVIDGRLLINGSFNWTFGAVTKNHENVMITDNKVLCEPYIDEFERLWRWYA